MSFEKLQDCIVKNFKYLEVEHSAILKKTNNSVEYSSKAFCVWITTNSGEVFVYVGQPDKSEFVELGQVVSYRLKLKSHGYGGSISGDVFDMVRRLALLLKNHCEAMLKGDFSCISDIKEYSKKIGLELGY